MTAGLVIFAVTYFLIAVQRLPFVHLNRPAASLLGAVAMVVAGVLSLQDAYAAIDFDVLVFLLGLMLIVGYLEVGKFFEWAAEWVLRRARTPDRLLLGVVVGGGLLSAFFVNDTICLVVTPVLLAALRDRGNVRRAGVATGASAAGEPAAAGGGAGTAGPTGGEISPRRRGRTTMFTPFSPSGDVSFAAACCRRKSIASRMLAS